MFKYIKFDRVETDTTVLEFRGGDDTVKVNYFTGVNVVSVEAENEDDINALVDAQVSDINCEDITQDEFKIAIETSPQYLRVLDRVAQYYDSLMRTITDKYPVVERETWGMQLEQAKAYKASNNEADAPFLKTLADAEGSTVDVFADAVIAKADAYALYSADALVKKRAFKSELLSSIGV